MLIKSSEITSEMVFNKRRRLIAAGLAVLALPAVDKGYALLLQKQEQAKQPFPPLASMPELIPEVLEPTPLNIITNYNNY
ncbi:MAG TPA: hypothetical protein EYQ12_02185 [Oceanospirillaceae bacterium]|nr:hypothetical protein [Oceanospirillaceae bacterium]